MARRKWSEDRHGNAGDVLRLVLVCRSLGLDVSFRPPLEKRGQGCRRMLARAMAAQGKTGGALWSTKCSRSQMALLHLATS